MPICSLEMLQSCIFVTLGTTLSVCYENLRLFLLPSVAQCVFGVVYID